MINIIIVRVAISDLTYAKTDRPAAMTTADDQAYLKDMALMSVMGTPNEYDAYGVITEAFVLHKQPRNRYTIFPQLRFPWNPEDPLDKRASRPDFAIGRYHVDHPHIRVQGGAEVKKAIPEMLGLPDAHNIAKIDNIQNELRACFFQAEDQVKSAIKAGYLPNTADLRWLLFVGPYFATIHLGPYSPAGLITCSHKKNPSGDFQETLKIALTRENMVPIHDLYLLGTPEAALALEAFINHTNRFLASVSQLGLYYCHLGFLKLTWC